MDPKERVFAAIWFFAVSTFRNYYPMHQFIPMI